MEWTSVVGTISTGIVGVQAMLKVYQRLRIMLRPTSASPSGGVTIWNGEVKKLFEAIGRIEERQDRHGRELQLVSSRVTGIEKRLAQSS